MKRKKERKTKNNKMNKKKEGEANKIKREENKFQENQTKIMNIFQ